MKTTGIALLLSLSACTTLSHYQPPLAKQPKDQAKYQADLEACRDYARPSYGEVVGGSFGLLGSGVMAAGGNDKAFKTSWTIVDECMQRKGYAVTK